jgi:hypothetical protein
VTPLSRQRPVLRPVFAKLGEALSALAGPQRSGVFLHQYTVVLQVRDQLDNRPERLSDVGLLDDGLGAAYNALRDLSYAEFYADDELSKRLDALGSAAARLRSASGRSTRPRVADVVARTSGVLTKMAVTFHDRVKTAAAGPPPRRPSRRRSRPPLRRSRPSPAAGTAPATPATRGPAPTPSEGQSVAQPRGSCTDGSRGTDCAR